MNHVIDELLAQTIFSQEKILQLDSRNQFIYNKIIDITLIKTTQTTYEIMGLIRYVINLIVFDRLFSRHYLETNLIHCLNR